MSPNSAQKKSIQRNTQNFSMIIMFIIIALCVLALLTALVIFWVPSLARDTFGPPAEGLDTSQQFLLSFSLISHKEQLTESFGNNDIPVSLIVNSGEGASVIADRLQSNYLIPDAKTFLNYLRYKGYDTSIQQGDFELKGTMSPIDIAIALQQPSATQIIIGMIPGWRVEEFGYSLESYEILENVERLTDIAKHPADIGITSRLPIDQGLEGFLIEGQYEFTRDGLTHEDILYAMLLNFEASLRPEWETLYTEKGLSLREAVILASIVQREAVVESEMPTIASVMLNRISAGMRLEMDSTVQYAIGWNENQQTWWTNPLSYADLEIDSPYNTYRISGLPAGPICSPSLKALEAVAYPAETDYYYFRMACDNSARHNFSNSYEEHLQNECQP